MNPPRSPLYRGVVIVGGIALATAMAVDVVAVIGRHARIPLLGSIEIVQVLVAIAGTAALLIATLNDRHAVVRLLLSRLQGVTARLVHGINAFALAIFMLALTLGSLWIMREMWHGQEESELWHLPYRPLRLIVSGTLATVTLLVLARVWRGGRS